MKPSRNSKALPDSKQKRTTAGSVVTDHMMRSGASLAVCPGIGSQGIGEEVIGSGSSVRRSSHGSGDSRLSKSSSFRSGCHSDSGALRRVDSGGDRQFSGVFRSGSSVSANAGGGDDGVDGGSPCSCSRVEEVCGYHQRRWV